jgi:hypothetical protein
MIQEEKYHNALKALNQILVRARWMAYESDSPELARMLDDAEILPIYIAESEDNTDLFQAALESMAQKFSCCAFIAEEFKKEPTTVV